MAQRAPGHDIDQGEAGGVVGLQTQAGRGLVCALFASCHCQPAWALWVRCFLSTLPRRLTRLPLHSAPSRPPAALLSDSLSMEACVLRCRCFRPLASASCRQAPPLASRAGASILVWELLVRLSAKDYHAGTGPPTLVTRLSSWLRRSPASAWVWPFCLGRPAFARYARWNGSTPNLRTYTATQRSSATWHQLPQGSRAPYSAACSTRQSSRLRRPVPAACG